MQEGMVYHDGLIVLAYCAGMPIASHRATYVRLLSGRARRRPCLGESDFLHRWVCLSGIGDVQF